MSVDTRARLIDAAAETFSKNGYHKTRMEDIANRAGVAKGTIYYNFENKAALFAELIITGINMIRDQVNKEISENSGAVAQLEGLIKNSLLICLKYDRVAMVLFNETDSGIDKQAEVLINRARENFFCLIHSKVSAGIASNEFRNMDSVILTGALMGLIGGTLISYLETDEQERPSHKILINTVTEVFLKGIIKVG